MELPNEGLVEHQERETSPSDKTASPAIIRTMETVKYLVEVITRSHPPFPVVVLPQVVTILELVWIAIGLCRRAALSSMERRNVVHVIVVESLGGREALVVERWVIRSPVATAGLPVQLVLLIVRRLGTYKLSELCRLLHHF